MAIVDEGRSMAIEAENDAEDEYESKERVLHRYFLQEWNTVNPILHDIVSSGGVCDISTVHKIRSIFEKYQEQGQLLEPYLESIVSPLLLLIRTKAIELGSESGDVLKVVKPLCIVIYTLVTVCGYKSVINFFPHQVSDLEPAVLLLEKCHGIHAATSVRQESTGEMEAKCVILLWLSILVLVPFDISTVDTSVDHLSNSSRDDPPPLVLRILSLCKDYLSSAGPMKTISGLVLSRLLTRPDMTKAFTSFIDWAHEILLSPTDNITDHRLLGVVEALAAVFKTGSRKVLLDMVSSLWDDASKLMKSNVAARNPLLRKYLIKLTQRVGLTCLPPRVPNWCYKGKVTSLGYNTLLDPERAKHCSGSPGTNSGCSRDGSMTYEHEEDMDVPELIEEIIEVLLIGLKDTDTVVRWSAAKGIGRITYRLTSSLADEVLSSVLELFSSSEGDGSWHGGCLALAELARRGLLLPTSLHIVVPVVAKALHYDIRKGPHSIGSHVRDAAAFVCWAFGRAYYHTDMRNVLEQLAPHLLTIACYDREVNCRRATAAAFQENVGRQGNYPHGIDIVNTADYFALSSRVNSYLHVAVYIAQFEGYLHSFVDELLNNKICHWDKGLRELASKALSALVKYDPGYFASYALDRLVPCTLSTDLCMRHGATLAAGELVLALHQCDYILSADRQKLVAGVVPAIEKARLYRGKGGEIMRSSVSRFIECISLAQITVPDKTKKSLLDALNENLRHPNSQIQNAAVKALKNFMAVYFKPVDEKVVYSITVQYVQQLRDSNVAIRRGSALALGALPYDFLAQGWKDVVLKLCKSCLIEENPDDRDVEARVNAVKGLVSVCEILIKSEDISCQSIEENYARLQVIKTEVMKSLFEALEDYSVDNRGDVGSWVRQAAMDGLERCTYILCGVQPVKMQTEQLEVHHVFGTEFVRDEQTDRLFNVDLATKLVGGLVKQAMEKLDKVREMAAKVLQRILYSETIFVHFIPHREKLEAVVPKEMGVNWVEPTFSYPRLVKLLQFCCYSRYVLSGLVIAIGGLQDDLRKASLSALLDYLQSTENVTLGEESSKEQSLSADIIWVLQQYKKCDRVIVPTLKTIEILFARKVFLSMGSQTGTYCGDILDSLRDELRGTRDFSKLYAGISILGYIASTNEAINSRAFSHLLTLLGHRYPKIRKACAEQVYLVLLQNGGLVTEDKTEIALEIVSETCWDGDVEEAKQQRLKLFEIAGLDAGPLLKSTSALSTKKDDQKKQIASDEHATYSSLVESSGF